MSGRHAGRRLDHPLDLSALAAAVEAYNHLLALYEGDQEQAVAGALRSYEHNVGRAS